jgi:hypothetical protein
LVNTTEERQVTVINPYDCDIQAEFYSNIDSTEAPKLHIGLPQSVIHFPAKSKQTIRLTASLLQGGDVQANLMYKISSGLFSLKAVSVRLIRKDIREMEKWRSPFSPTQRVQSIHLA